ncbi:MAG TPA: hypothetical protein VMT08_32740 [Bradyrhizobium sp.]|nr:hypothetical protein [Bradyrhizobium sp.]
MAQMELPSCFDPYLRYAIASDFKYFKFFDARNFKLSLLVEFRTVALAKTFKTDMKSDHAIEFSPADHGSRYTTIRAHKSVVTDPGTFPIWIKCVSRVELSLPVKPVTGPPEKILRNRWAEGKEKSGELLIGVLDDGCPFAAAQFLTASGTRVRGIWDQNRNKQPITTVAGVFGQVPSDFTYGVEFLRDFATPTSQIGLNEWIGLHRTTAGSIDEDGCYADADFKPLKHRLSHGAHVLDVVAGSIPTSSRIGPSRPGQDRRDPPSFAVATDPASGADLVFVQFPEDGIRDGTGVWLKAYVEEGIQYIMTFAEPNRTKKVIVNLSYGPTTGPHDGTALLEEALNALVTYYDGTQGKPELEIVLPAGNAYLSEGHVACVGPGTTQAGGIEWMWRLPPDNSVLCFAEIWMSTNDASGVVVTLGSPSGLISTSTAGPIPPPNGIPFPSFTGAYAPLTWGSSTVWLLAVEPTIATSGFVPEHGDWMIRIDGVGANAKVHAYAARSDPNMDVRSGAKLSYFVDPKWQRTRSADASCNYANGEFDQAGSQIHRYGTLNGIATASVPTVHVAGGYIISNRRKSRYSSAGPARGGTRYGPDYVLPCDESYALAGIRAGGNRSRAVFRLVGTSTAAPQLARQLAKLGSGLLFPTPTDVPSLTDVAGRESRGGGNIEPS